MPTFSNTTSESQFGGIYYLFIRGIHKDHPGSGIYFDRPPLEAIQKLDNVFQES
jgi:exodeoxyribonuclease V beta subunit